MSSSKQLRPILTHLEDRLLPTAALAYPDVVRTAIHDSYVAQADQGTTSVEFLGDSITYLWGTAARTNAGSASWNADFASQNALNFGIPGDQTQNLLYRVQNGELDGSPKVAVVMIGINDILGGRTASQTAAGVASVVNAIRVESPDTQVLLLGVLPTASTTINATVNQLDVDLTALKSSHVTYLDIDSRLETANGTLPAGETSDGVHPNAIGYAVLASAIEGPLNALLDPVATPAPTPPTFATATKPLNLSIAPAPTTTTETIPIVLDASTINPASTQLDLGSTTAPRKSTASASAPSSIIALNS